MSFPLTNNPSLYKASHIVDELIKNEIKTFFISPGMRNAPLLAALESHPDAVIEIGMDERAHAYKALGYSKDNQSPACLICTSGTALANYYPAVIEAYKSEIPLVILSADRPYKKVLGGDNQTIEQYRIYQGFSLKSYSLLSDNIFNREMIDEGVHHAIKEGGPAHFNIPFEEPLDSTTIDFSFNNEMELFLKGPTSSLPCNYSSLPFEIQKQLEKAHRPLVVIAEMPSKAPKDNITQFLKNFNGLKYIDVTSGLKFNFNLENYTLPSLDHPEVYRYLENFNPDFILHLGGRVVSKFYYRFLENSKSKYIYQINNLNQKTDPSFRMKKLKTCPDQAIKSIHKEAFIDQRQWSNLISFVQRKRALIESGPLTFPQLSKTLIESAPPSVNFYLGNSTTIRSFDSFSSEDLTKDFNIFSHRGVSGIEGFVAASSSIKGPTTLVLGDVSFYHDLNSLLYLTKVSHPYVGIIVNDFGGGIFEQLPIQKDTKVIPYLTSPHEINFGPICHGLGIEHICVTDVKTLIEQYLLKIKQNKASIIEVKIDRKNNFEIYQKLKTIKL